MARKWAEEAIERDPKNSQIKDTLGQVHKHHLLNEAKKTFPNIKHVCPLHSLPVIHLKMKINQLKMRQKTTLNNRSLWVPPGLQDHSSKNWNIVSSSVVSKVMLRQNMI